jgi:undecaprenyl pyrophosphate synthase
MEILIISGEDGRLPIVDLARTLGDMTKQGKLFPEEISIDLVNEELTGKTFISQLTVESLMTEPDLLILFSPQVDLQGFPPWQLRLTEILYRPCFRRAYCSHLPDNSSFNYSIFLRGLQEYDRAEFRIGR